MMDTCASLTGAYLSGKDGRADRIEEAELERERQKVLEAWRSAEAAREAGLASLQLSALASRGGSIADQVAALGKSVVGSVKLSQETDEAVSKLVQQRQLLQQLVTESIDDLPKLESGKGFVGQQFAFYVAVGASAAPYLDVLSKQAAGQRWDGLRKAVDAVAGREKVDEAAIAGIVKELTRLELQATRDERVRK